MYFFPQLTETSSRYSRKISGTTALQEALKEKQQHIEQLMAERDMERAEVAKATGHVGEMEQEITLLRDDREQVSPLRELLVTVTFQWCKENTQRQFCHIVNDTSDTVSISPLPDLNFRCREFDVTFTFELSQFKLA